MSNLTSKGLVDALQTSTVQNCVEEAYLNSLLSPIVINQGGNPEVGGDAVNVTSVMVSEPSKQHCEESDVGDSANDSEIKTQPMQVDSVRADDIYTEKTWPQTNFACQIITLAGLKLALPLSSYTQSFPWPDKLNQVEESDTILMGHMQHGACVFDIVDLPALILNRSVARPANLGDYNYSHIMLLQDGSTCLPCDGIAEVVTVNPDKVCWRNPGSKRVWLAGTVKDEGLALLDADRIMQLLGKC